jgi:hypothetical protein
VVARDLVLFVVVEVWSVWGADLRMMGLMGGFVSVRVIGTVSWTFVNSVVKSVVFRRFVVDIVTSVRRAASRPNPAVLRLIEHCPTKVTWERCEVVNRDHYLRA